MINKGILFFLVMLLFESCIDRYAPPEVRAPNQYLVIDGFINSGSGPTTFKLSYTRNLVDTTKVNYPNGKVFIESKGSGSFELSNKGNGVFTIEQLDLNSSDLYRLSIILSDGKRYYSDYVEVKNTPEIDSITWKRNNDGVNIYINAHDAEAKTRYYQWNYSETWEFHSAFYSQLKYVDKKFILRPQEEEFYVCYKSGKSPIISVGSSERLSDDVIHEFPLTSISASKSDKLSVRYSILVKQYAVTKKGYDYWQNLKLISESLGGVFDPQPSTLKGNFYSAEDPLEPVLGFLSVCDVEEKRLFITRSQYGDIVYTGYEDCEMLKIGELEIPKLFNSQMIPLFIIKDRSGMDELFVGDIPCTDCRLRGTIVKPDFW